MKNCICFIFLLLFSSFDSSPLRYRKLKRFMNRSLQFPPSWKKFRRDRTGKTWFIKNSGGMTKIVGFHNIDKITNSKKKALTRKTVDPDTKLLILPPKPIVVIPMIIRPNKLSPKVRLRNHFLI